MGQSFGLLAAAVLCATVACSRTENGNETCAIFTESPFVQLLYPEPGQTGVPDGLASIVYGATQNGSLQGPAAGLPVTLEAGSSTTAITTAATAVPSPVPSPAFTPLPAATTFAVAVPQLAPSTTYTVYATVDGSVCDSPGRVQTQAIGSFTTQ